MNYKGFISYKHGADDALAERLEIALEKFAKPTFKRRSIEIFRDSNDLSAAADLGEKIRNGLQNSEFFICMASPAYAKSKWCVREAEYWRDNKSIDNFLIVLTAGEILWDESTNDFDWNVTTAIPKELSGAFKGEPFYIDFRNVGPKESMTLDNPEFKNKVVYIAAPLHKKNVGDMIGEAMRQHKRTLRIRNTALTIVFSLMTIALVLSVSSIKRRIASQLHFQAKALVPEDPSIALHLEAAALKRYDFVEFRNTALSIIANNNFYKIIAKSDSLNIKAIDLSPISNILAVAYDDGSVAFMDFQGAIVKQFQAHDDEINSIAFSPDGSTIVTGSYDKKVKIWDLNGKSLGEYSGHTNVVNEAIFAPDGKTILSTSNDGSIRLIDLYGSLLNSYKSEIYGFYDISIAADGQSFVTSTSGLSQSNVIVWSIDGAAKTTINLPWITALDYSADGENIISGHSNGTINYMSKYGDTLWQHKGTTNAAVNSIKFSSNGQSILVSYANGEGQELNKLGEVTETFIGHHRPVSEMIYTANEDAIVTASFDNTIRIWQLNRIEKSAIEEYSGLKGFVNAVAFSPNEKEVLGADENGDAILWNINGETIKKMSDQKFGVGYAQFINNGKSIITTSKGGAHVQSWPINSDTPTQYSQDLMHFYPVAISPDGSKVFLGSVFTPHSILWDLDSNTTDKFDISQVESAAFSPDGQRILVGSKDGKARLLDLMGNVLKEYNAHGYVFTSYEAYPVSSVVFNADGETIAMGCSDGNIRIAKVKGRVLADFKGHKDAVNALSFSPDGKSLLSVSYDKTAKLWDLRGTLLSDISRQTGEVVSLAFSSDSKSILAGSTDGKVQLIRFINVEDFLEKYVEPLSEEQRLFYDVD